MKFESVSIGKRLKTAFGLIAILVVSSLGASAEALALYRCNALDASVKGAFEQGL